MQVVYTCNFVSSIDGQIRLAVWCSILMADHMGQNFTTVHFHATALKIHQNIIFGDNTYPVVKV